jgi:hypothetical protein
MTRSYSTIPGRALVAGIIALAASQGDIFAQGCVAVRGAGSCAANPAGMTNVLDSKWFASVSYRWLHSDRHFVGDVEQTRRHEIGNQVINDSHFSDLGLSYSFTPRYSASLALPFVHHDRSSWYEHTRTNRHHSQSGGLGDARKHTAGSRTERQKVVERRSGRIADGDAREEEKPLADVRRNS